MPIDFKNFNVSDATKTGGMTGSSRVKHNDGNFYQLKPSILVNKLFRRIKAGGTDRENFGEVIASKIGRSIMKEMGNENGVPDVSLVYDKNKKQVSVASKYLKGEKVQTLDDYAKEKDESITTRHATFVNGEPASPGQYNINKESESFRKGLAKGIVVSALVGDHDVNPGNMMVVDGRPARIDFGHAFNDLLNTTKNFGGEVRNKENQMLDFLNREKIASFPKGGKPKLWRDYPGMVPSEELASAFKEMGEAKGLQEGVRAAKQEFKDLIRELDANNDPATKKHVLNSLNAINNAIEGGKLDPKQGLDQQVDKVFDNVGKFCDKNQKNMMEVGNLMSLQVDIDKALKENRQIPAAQMDNFKRRYTGLDQAKKQNGTEHTPIEWVKNSPNKPAFKGNLQEYITERQKQMGLEQSMQEGVKQDATPPKKQSFINRLSNRTSRNSQKVKTQDIEMKEYNAKSEAQEKPTPPKKSLSTSEKLKKLVTSRKFSQIKSRLSGAASEEKRTSNVTPNVKENKNEKGPER